MVDFTSRKVKGFRGFDADRRRDRILSTIYVVHKECRAGEIWILSTQRIPRGRGSDVDLHKRFMGPCFNDNVLSKMSAIVKTIPALRALVLQKLFPKDSNLG